MGVMYFVYVYGSVTYDAPKLGFLPVPRRIGVGETESTGLRRSQYCRGSGFAKG